MYPVSTQKAPLDETTSSSTDRPPSIIAGPLSSAPPSSGSEKIEYSDEDEDREHDAEHSKVDVNEGENDSDSLSIASSRSSLVVFEVSGGSWDSDGESSTEEERYAAKIDKQLEEEFKDREYESQDIKDFFLKPLSKDDKRCISWTGRLGSRKSVEEIVEAVRSALDGQDRFVACPNSNRSVGECRFDPTHQASLGPDETPDIVILTREAVTDRYWDFAAAWNHLYKGEKDVRDWAQVAGVGIIHRSDSSRHNRSAVPRLKRQLLRMLSTPIRDFAYGFTLLGSSLTIYILTHSGLFYSPSIECTLENGNLSTYLFRFLDMGNLDLGIRMSYIGELNLESLERVTLSLP
ncbi:BQ2448_6102 [Microbotryum intermedium]|uniref:BQ2448_6102 protein n=1 Tax=Microbotryum intermedium TaxID=269621 RepID=A0A238FIR2_9BASI|nr:BQ2448_6102 [Microbotryum intermedium]